MNCNLPKITYSTFRLLLLLKIHEAISPKGDVEVAKRSLKAPIIAVDAGKSNRLPEKTILSRVKKSTSVAAYQSAIALQIAALSDQNPTLIAGEIAEVCRRCSCEATLLDPNFVEASLRDLTVGVTEAGFIQFEFGDRALAAWLRSWLNDQSLQQLTLERLTDSNPLNEDQTFVCQYTYARAKSLLQMAKSLRLEPSILGEVASTLLKPSERSLLFAMVSIADELIDATAQTCANSAIALAQAFAAFDRDCRILAQQSITQCHVAQRRLALVMITQLLLRALLEQKLNVFLPDSL